MGSPPACAGRILATLARDTRGSNAVEYALLAAMVAITAITGISAFSDSAVQMWSDLGDAIAEALN